jgi:hypothetical protein
MQMLIISFINLMKLMSLAYEPRYNVFLSHQINFSRKNHIRAEGEMSLSPPMWKVEITRIGWQKTRAGAQGGS